MRIIISNGHVITGDGGPEQPDTDIAIEHGIITSIGKGLLRAGSEVIDAEGLLVLPGFVDSHRHLWQAPLRGIGADMTLPDYFETILGKALHAYTPSDAHLATLVGALEALDTGVTTVADWSNTSTSPEHTEASLDGLAASGIRAVAGIADPADAKRLPRANGRIGLALTALGPQYGGWDNGILEIDAGRSLGLQVWMHASGGPQSPFLRMHEQGLLGPDLHLIHMNAMTADEAHVLADAGVGVTVTPVVEATMGHGVSAFETFRDAGGHAGLGVDVVVNSAGDMFEVMRDTLRFIRMRRGAMVLAAEILPHAIVHSARSIGLADQTGSMAVGKRADIILLDGLAHPTASGLVASLTPSNVRTVIVDGTVLKHNGRLLHHDMQALKHQANQLAGRVLGKHS